MVQRTKRHGDAIPQSAEVLKALGVCRQRMIEATTQVRPFCPAHHAVSVVVTAIDTLATFLTGQPYYFSIGGSTAPAESWRILPTNSDDADEP